MLPKQPLGAAHITVYASPCVGMHHNKCAETGDDTLSGVTIQSAMLNRDSTKAYCSSGIGSTGRLPFTCHKSDLVDQFEALNDRFILQTLHHIIQEAVTCLTATMPSASVFGVSEVLPCSAGVDWLQ